MIPISPGAPSAKRYRDEVSEPLATSTRTSGKRSLIRSRISFPDTTSSRDHSCPESSGMNSMNRIFTSYSRANAAKSATSSSLWPRTITALILIGSSPAFFARPLLASIDRHGVNESHLHVVLTRKRSEIGDLVFVMATHDHRIDFDRLESRFLRSVDSGKHFVQHIDAGHVFENISLQTVETDRDPIEPGVLKTLRTFRQVVSVGGQREITKTGTLQSRKLLDNRFDIAAQHGFAAGEPELFNTQRHKYLADVVDLFVREHLLFRRDRRFTVRKTIETAEVTTVRQRHTQVANRAVIGIGQHAVMIPVGDHGLHGWVTYFRR